MKSREAGITVGTLRRSSFLTSPLSFAHKQAGDKQHESPSAVSPCVFVSPVHTWKVLERFWKVQEWMTERHAGLLMLCPCVAVDRHTQRVSKSYILLKFILAKVKAPLLILD